MYVMIEGIFCCLSKCLCKRYVYEYNRDMYNGFLLCVVQIQRNTTPMYRSPEMIDLYSNHPISEKADIWVSIFSHSLTP